MALFSRQVLEFDKEATAERLATKLREVVTKKLRRRGIVVAISGGIDSACVAALAVRALGKDRVFGIMLPEQDSSDESLTYAKELAGVLGIRYEVKNIASTLAAVGCYEARDAAVKEVFPQFTPECKWKIVMHGDRLSSETLNFYYVVVRTPDGNDHRVRLTPSAYLQIVAATNYKQRVRKMLEYYHADRLIYAVAATPNRQEYDQGFFVKLGDGAGDVKPIAALYKAQTYALADHLGVPKSIVNRAPTTDTYSLEQSQEEFYFSVPYQIGDLFLWAKNHDVPAEEAAKVLGYTKEQAERVYNDIDQKRRTTAYLHSKPLLLDPVDEIEPFAIK